MSDAPITVAIADDHMMFVQAIQIVLDTSPDIRVVSVAETGHGLLEDLRALQPDVALVDISMEGPGFHAIAQEQAGTTRLLALTMHLDRDLAERVMDAGFAGYLVKDAAVAELISAIKIAADGGTFLSRAIEQQATPGQDRPNRLTNREIACIQGASEGHSNREISDRLGIAERTVKFHFENIFRKLDVKSRGEAVAAARRDKLY